MVFSCAGALGVGDVHLEFDRLLEDSGSGRGLVLCSETGLGYDAVAQTGNLSETDRARCVSSDQQQNPQQSENSDK